MAVWVGFPPWNKLIFPTQHGHPLELGKTPEFRFSTCLEGALNFGQSHSLLSALTLPPSNPPPPPQPSPPQLPSPIAATSNTDITTINLGLFTMGLYIFAWFFCVLICCSVYLLSIQRNNVEERLLDDLYTA